MDVKISDRKLRKVIKNERKLGREYGKVRAGKILERMEELKRADTLEDLRTGPGNYHELIGDRKGQWACNLDQPYRMIFIPQEDPIPTDEHGRYIWIEIEGVEITDYH